MRNSQVASFPAHTSPGPGLLVRYTCKSGRKKTDVDLTPSPGSALSHAPLKIGSDAHAAIIAANFFQRRHGSTKVCWIRDSARNQRLFPGSELPEKLPFFHLPLGTKPHGFISRRATFCRWSSCCSPPLHKAMLMQKTTR